MTLFISSAVLATLVLSGPPASASPPEYKSQEQAIVNIRQTPAPLREWLGVDGKPLPFKGDHEIRDFLLTAEIVDTEDLPVGVTQPIRVTLEKDGIKAHAVFRHLEARYRRLRMNDGGFRLNLKDSCLLELAAYEVSQMMGMDNVPPAIERRFRGKRGTLQMWVYNTVMEYKRVEQGTRPPSRIPFRQQVQEMYLFDNLIGNWDRTQENILIDDNWKLWLIDHTRSFYAGAEIQNLDKVIYVDRAFWEALQALDEPGLKQKVGKYLSSSEIETLLERRDKLVEHIQGLIDSRGKRAVLYD